MEINMGQKTCHVVMHVHYSSIYSTLNQPKMDKQIAS